MLLEGKVAIVYGGGESIGGAAARAFGREGATVHLAGRTLATLDAVAEDIRTAGGTAETAEVDALDEAIVDLIDSGGRGQRGRLRRLGLGAQHDRGHGQRERRRPD